MVIVHDICYQVVYREIVQDFFNPSRSKQEIESRDSEDLDVPYWILMYCIFVTLHTINTTLVY